MAVATRGPVPGRSDTTRRRNNKAEITKTEDVPVELPYPAKVGWQAQVCRLWESLADSGMAQYYKSSDWAFAYILLDTLNKALTEENHMTGLISFGSVKDCLKELARLGVTEGDRRRLRIELEQKDTEEQAKVVIMDNYRKIVEQDQEQEKQ